MKLSMRVLTAAACLCFGSLASAGTDGTYVLEGGAYSINVKFVSDGLEIVEPNKTSLYTPNGAGAYEFTNPTNGIRYGLRVIDDSTIEAYKPGSSSAPTTLKLSSMNMLENPEDSPTYDKYSAIAEKYMQLSQTDPDNVHVWTACGAAALAFMHQSEEDALQTASQSAMLLKQIIVDGSGTPCADAIPASVW
jgi:hypothetical protein